MSATLAARGVKVGVLDVQFGGYEDLLGDDLPPDELNRAAEPGLHFGFPFCHGGDLADPEFGDRRSCSEFVPPAATLGLMLGHGDMTNATGAGLLLAINIVCVNLACKLVFWLKGIRPRVWWEKEKARRGMRNSVIAWILTLAALIAILLTPLYIWWLIPEPALLAAMVFMGTLLFWRHRSNIENLLQGTEGRIGSKPEKPAE